MDIKLLYCFQSDDKRLKSLPFLYEIEGDTTINSDCVVNH